MTTAPCRFAHRRKTTGSHTYRRARSSFIVSVTSSREKICGRGLQTPHAATITGAVSRNFTRGGAGVSLHAIHHATTTTAAQASVTIGRPPAA